MKKQLVIAVQNLVIKRPKSIKVKIFKLLCSV